MPLTAGARLGPYEILSPLGAGGMGEVYRARDTRLDRTVAIKVLPQSVAADPDSLARFEREAKAIAALSHPNILSIFDFGTQEGVTYAVMELLEGETLRGRLDAGPIPQKQAVDYALQIAKGLSAAHERGVVHRDLKPENLFVAKDGHLKILDFGLAKRIEKVVPGEETSAPTVSGHTMPGTVMGTLGYMSPEQVKGLAVDHRSDLFSFGAVLYEMLSGARPFTRATASETMSAILKEEPPELSESGRNISPALDHIVKHCLEKDRDNRFQTAKDIAFALSEQSSPAVTSGVRPVAPHAGKRKFLVASAAIIVLAFAGIFVLRRSNKGGGEAAGLKRLAVLPFENLGAPEDDYFADGMSDAVRGKLTSLRGLEVIARASSVAYKKTSKAPKAIAQELDAPFLLTATVRWQKSGATSRVQVSPELIEVKGSGAPASRWQEPFDAALTDVFQVQSDVATRVAEALGVAMRTGEEKRLEEKPTKNLAAYEAFLKGEEIRKNYPFGILSPSRALSSYEQAVALDPDFALAWAGVSRMSSAVYDDDPAPEVAERARTAAARTAALAPNTPETYLALGEYQGSVLYNAQAWLEQASRAERLAPKNVEVLSALALAESILGRKEAAAQYLRRAERLDPRAAPIKSQLGSVLLWLRRYEEARESLDRSLTLMPASLGAIESRAMTFLGQGDLSGARAAIRAASNSVEQTALVAHLANIWDLAWVLDDQQLDLLLRLTPSTFNGKESWASCLAQGYALRREPANIRIYAEQAVKAYEELLRATPQFAEGHALLAMNLAYLGRKEQAIREGQHAVELTPMAKDSILGAYSRHLLARVYILVGEPEKALDQLEPLLKIPYILSPGWLKIDPNFDPLRTNPRFQKLVAGAK